ncbi:ASCH domain-containing protein, partial [Acinetobacter baumannii]
MAQELADLVLEGKKRATATLVWDYEAENKLMPFVGCFSVVTNWKGNPLFVMRSTEIQVVPFDEVTAE